MNIRKSLEEEHSKKATMAIIRYVGDDKKRFKELLDIFLKGDYRLTQRSAWALGDLGVAHPDLLNPHAGRLMARLKDESQHPAIARNILRIFENTTTVPEKYQSELFDLCCGFMLNENKPIAIRAFAITCASRIAKPFPELKNELLIMLSELSALPQGPAIRVRIKSALKELKG
jgi:hypothetical protein